MKTCPRCAEGDIAADARVCKHCGHDFRAAEPVARAIRVLAVVAASLVVVVVLMRVLWG